MTPARMTFFLRLGSTLGLWALMLATVFAGWEAGFFALMAAMAMRALWEKGISIPGSTAVVGFDDSPLAAFAEPPLTTIRQPVDLMGKAAAELLVGSPQEGSARPCLFEGSRGYRR